MTKNASESLSDFEAVWDNKPVLRLVYGDLFKRIAKECVEGGSIEIGGGIGNLKQYIPSLWSSDIQWSGRLDLVADAQRLPFADGALSNIVMLDVLHHIEYPIQFFREAARVLRPGGRIVMVEPAITAGSQFFYRYLHRELVDMSDDPLRDGLPDPARDPYASNQAIPTLLATKYRDQFHDMLPELRISNVEWFSFAAYPLSGGFQKWGLISSKIAAHLIGFERKIERRLGRLMGFRLLMSVTRR